MFGAQEPAFVGDGDARLAQQGASLRAVGHCGEEAGIGTAVIAAARPAVIGRQVGIVVAVGAVAQDHHQGGEALVQAHDPQ